MGLFDKKPPCPICGGKVPSLFAWKIDGQAVCNECYGDVELSDETMKSITLGEFKEYMAYRKENELLKQKFQISREVHFGWLGQKFVFDMDNRLLCLDKKLRRSVYEGGQVQSFEIREDNQLLFTGSPEGLVCYQSTVVDRVIAMSPQIEQLKIQIQMRREMEYLMECRKQEDKDNYQYRSLPDIHIPVPFEKFYVEIHFEHPYLPVFEMSKIAPSFGYPEPDVDEYLKCYNKETQLMEELARALKEVAFPGAPERTVAAGSITAAGSGGVTAPGVAVDTVEELKRFKELVDKGILTEEEFAAKKRQLLGI